MTNVSLLVTEELDSIDQYAPEYLIQKSAKQISELLWKLDAKGIYWLLRELNKLSPEKTQQVLRVSGLQGLVAL